jgi:hypothetical protein
MRRALATPAVSLAFPGAMGTFASVTADCAGPQVRVPSVPIEVGSSFLVRGRYWRECNDTCGCVSCVVQGEGDILGPVSIEIRPRGAASSVILADGVEVGGRASFAMTVQMPSDTDPGRYLVIVTQEGGPGIRAAVPIRVAGPEGR